MKNFKFLLTLSVLFLVCFFSVPPPVNAASVAFKITDPFYAPPPSVGGVGRVVFWTSILVEYKGGKMILSKNPDGTGTANVGDAVQMTVGFQTFNYNTSCNSKPLQPTDVTNYFPAPGTYSVMVRLIDWCGQAKNISSLYLVNTGLPDPTPTITPSPTATPLPTATPTPTGPQPFLDLPWKYEDKGLSFNEAALSMTSYFDHEYPLLSSALVEPQITNQSVVKFDTPLRGSYSYTSHDGYDYAKKAKALLGEPVTAAAAGIATYINTCAPCGNMIQIDHENGYQTRYLHLQKDGLITNTPGEKIPVVAAQPIGKVGATGNVWPKGDGGAHIHFMVVEDKDKDGNFTNNIPDGVTDPFGWKSSKPDPWEDYTFNQGGQEKKGNKSNYLWTKKLDSMKGTITPASASTFKAGNYTLEFPATSTNQDIVFEVESSSNIHLIDQALASLGPSITAIAKDLTGNLITTFSQPFTMIVDFNTQDLTPYDKDSISLYSSEDGVNWLKESTVVDLDSKQAKAQLNHLSYFTLMAKRVDTVSPTTTSTITGTAGKDNSYRSDVTVELLAKDNDSGLGVDYTFYKKEGSDWETYTTPLLFTQEGHHKVEFYSVDKDENIEKVQTKEFDIDKIHPELTLYFDRTAKDIIFYGDNSSTISMQILDKNREKVVATDPAGNTATVQVRDRERGKTTRLTFENIQYNNEELISPLPYTLSVVYDFDKRNNLVRAFEQVYKVSDQMRLQLIYDAKNHKTTIITQNNNGEKTTESVVGLKILQLSTQNGTVNYKY